MNVVKSSIIFVLLTLVVRSSQAMEEERNDRFTKLPREVHIYILQCLDRSDLLNVFFISKAWHKISEDDYLLRPLVEKKLGSYADQMKKKAETWKDLLLRWPSAAAQHVLNMPIWTKTDIKTAISENNYPQLEQALIKFVELETIAALKQKVTTTKDFLSGLLAYYLTNISAIKAAGDRDLDDAFYFVKNACMNAVWDAAWNPPWVYPDWSKHEKDVYSNFWNDFWNIGCQDAINASKKAIIPVMQKCLVILYTEKDIYQAKYVQNLSRLYVLAFIGRREFIDDYFLNTYVLAKIALNNDYKFNKSTVAIKDIFAKHTWDNEELKNNPYIQSLKRIFETLANLIKD